MTSARTTVWVSGSVQGVGLRWWTRARALERGLVGWARNTSDGRVEVVAEGPEDALAELERLLAVDPVPPGRPGHVVLSVVSRSVSKGLGPGFRER
jgi:acylphosphatase